MTHPMEMSLSVTGWDIEPDLLNEMCLELVHSEQFGDCLLVKLAFKNGTGARIEVEVKDGHGMTVYDALTEAIRVRRVPEKVIEGDAQPEV